MGLASPSLRSSYAAARDGDYARRQPDQREEFGAADQAGDGERCVLVVREGRSNFGYSLLPRSKS